LENLEKSIALLFNYLKDILYDSDHAFLDINSLHPDCQKLGEEIKYIAECLLEVMKHITWQSPQVEKGDYQQRIEFMGEFSDSFNAMIKQLDQRQKALEAEVEKSHRKTLALEQSNSLFEAIVNETLLWIFVISIKTKKCLFMNKAAETALALENQLSQSLNAWLKNVGDSGIMQANEIKLNTDEGELFYSVQSYPIQMCEDHALAYVLRDITSEKKEVTKLETAAHIDSLTHLYNRYFGMKILHNWLAEDRLFCLCFVDVDYLKYVNDTFGHREGDRYIINVANSLRSFFSEAIVSRLGGDEFMVLIEDISEDEAERSFSLLCEKLHKSSLSKDKDEYKPSISYGIVEVGHRCSLEASDLLSLADERMYHFKRMHKVQRIPDNI
jgi:diguanylate cyclase (GGDEF)-like protein